LQMPFENAAPIDVREGRGSGRQETQRAEQKLVRFFMQFTLLKVVSA
jgi:hypothetical protein